MVNAALVKKAYREVYETSKTSQFWCRIIFFWFAKNQNKFRIKSVWNYYTRAVFESFQVLSVPKRVNLKADRIDDPPN